jgi:DNA-binding beta-propeller fold protein YncE
VSADGKSAYVTNINGGTVSQYTVAANGALSPKTPATVATGSSPFAVAVSADGKSAYVANDGGNTVSQFTVAANGTLSPKTPATVATGVGPGGVAVTPIAPAITSLVPSSGPPGGAQAVTISGSNYTGASSVKFGASAASSVVVVSRTKITAKTPAHAPGAVDVRVVTPAGSSAVVAADKYTFT